ncbi:AGAP009119-PA-like protein [Anopheles sinensis]|uniref:AGAP009119-PA-like protein n=1 Tax=Anopheles sinensis TaxID=74873 RepID=A0A084VG85_ANOSI|nr:AGAP009119-PA-like protein [Anopheles sinensis]
MECPINPAELQKLKVFINLCQMTPQLLNLPQLDFLKSFIVSLGGKVPEGQPDFGSMGAKGTESSSNSSASAEAKTTTKEEEAPPVVESDPESDLELDNEGCVEPDTEPDQPMGDASKEPSEEEFDQANDLRSQAAAAYSEQKYDEAVKLFTEAIQLNPKSALYYAKRGQAYLKLQKPNACIRDCNRALEINPDSATAYKFRGRANRLLGHWEEAAKDLRQACKLDFDEEADEWLKEVTPNAKKIEQHKQKQERRKQEREFRERQERVRKAQEANRKAAEEGPAGGAGGMPDFGGAGADLFNAFRDPEVSAAMSDIFSNPANISKYQNNPKIMNILMKFYSQAEKGGVPGFPGAGGAGGAGGFPGFPGFGGGAGGFPGLVAPVVRILVPEERVREPVPVVRVLTIWTKAMHLKFSFISQRTFVRSAFELEQKRVAFLYQMPCQLAI